MKSEIVDSSDSSILSQQIDSPPVLSPSKGITRINPRRSSILVSPTKKTVPQFTISKLSVPEQSQRVQFYLGQVLYLPTFYSDPSNTSGRFCL